MSEASYQLKDRFPFGTTVVEILQGDILDPGVDVHFLVSTDDNYLTMGSGVSRRLREKGGPKYVQEAQSHCPMKAGTATITGPHDLARHKPLQSLRNVLHGAVIDYDTEDLALEHLVRVTTTDCLSRAEELIRKASANGEESAEWSILFPAFATGGGDLGMDACARQMCSAIKAYLANERPLKRIYIMLYLPENPGLPEGPTQKERPEDLNREYMAAANLILDVPYDPAEGMPRTRDIWPNVEPDALRKLISGELQNGKRHAVILGGPRSGKSVLVDQLLEEARQRDSKPGKERTLVKVSFGRLHSYTPASFIYQKLLCALDRVEHDREVHKALRATYAELADYADLEDDRSISRQSCDCFLKFLNQYGTHYPNLVFLIDNLPLLLAMESDDPKAPRKAREFWKDLDKLGERVQFICTARDDEQYEYLRDRLGDEFEGQLLPIRLTCVSKEDRKQWVNVRYQSYFGRDAIQAEQSFIEQEAGLHPYLIDLASYALIKALKRDAIESQKRHPERPQSEFLARFFQEARLTIDRPRRDFFGELMAMPTGQLRSDLRNLSRAVVCEEELQQLADEDSQLIKEKATDPNLKRRLMELAALEDYRENLHKQALQQLEAQGLLVRADSPKTVQFMAKPFALYVQEFFRPPNPIGRTIEPKDLSISLLWNRPESMRLPDSECDFREAPEKKAFLLRTMLCGRGARVLTAQKPFSPEIKQQFLSNFDQLVACQLHPTNCDAPGDFLDLEEVGNYILTQFTTVAIKEHLRELPFGSTVLLIIDDALKDIPWELMLETSYAGEIPFCVGRAVISSLEPKPIGPAVRSAGKIKALLIGDPADNLPHAIEEVTWLYDTLVRDNRFSEPVVLTGSSDCTPIRLLKHLASGEYGLVHYSGHTHYACEQSAWLLKTGQITTDQLTNAIQMAPPALVFSSSCESAEASEAKPIEYEGQAFDLPSAFLQAGVEAYIGTLWNVYSEPAKKFTQEFYSAFLSSECNLGECVRRAKWSCKQGGDWRDRIHWLAYVLYGNPHTWPGDLLPTLAVRKS